MDDDAVRRGKPTVHVAFGEAVAVLAGDALLAAAFEVLEDASMASVRELARAAGSRALVGGQADDLTLNPGEADAARIESIHQRKTGAMISVSLRLGGLVSGASAAQLAALEQYGRRVGLAFQIIDDLLDVHGDEEAIGKRTGKDHERGKLTFPGLLGVTESTRRAQQLVEEACRALVPLGPRAGGLEALARYVVERNH
jgi:geranylgeranyl diphosphate synthase type II